MDWIAIALALILFVVAAIHLSWALGSTWPVNDPESLSAAVVGTPEATKMPSAGLTFVVALMIAAAALWPLLWQALAPYPHWVPQTLVWLGMWCLAIVFLVRGVGGFLPMAGKTIEPFRRLNRTIYSPLCIVLGAGYLYLVLNP